MCVVVRLSSSFAHVLTHDHSPSLTHNHTITILRRKLIRCTQQLWPASYRAKYEEKYAVLAQQADAHNDALEQYRARRAEERKNAALRSGGVTSAEALVRAGFSEADTQTEASASPSQSSS
jgi:hypothetical protein